MRRLYRYMLVGAMVFVLLFSAPMVVMQHPARDSGLNEHLRAQVPVVSKGIWVWGSTIRGKESEFMQWVIQHNYTDVFVLIKGVSGTVKYDVLSTLLNLTHEYSYSQRIWAWVVGFHDESHANSSWDYLVGDWISPADTGYRSYLASIVRKAIDPSLGYVSYVPYGVMLDDTFQWPSHDYGSNVSYRVATIMDTVAEIKSEIDTVENSTHTIIHLGFAPHPETSYYSSDGSGGYYTYSAYEYGQDFGSLATLCDYLAPETYRYGFYDEPSSWIAQVVNDIRNEIQQEHPAIVNDVKIYPALILYNSDTDPTPIYASDLQSDISSALNATDGFNVFRYASASVNPGNGEDAYDYPTTAQESVLDNYVPEQENISLATALDSPLIWHTGGNATWFGESNISYFGGSAAQSGTIGDGESTYLYTTVTGPGNISFVWKVSSELNHDFLSFYIDDTKIKSISGNVSWEEETYQIDAGTHTLKWVYAKDSSGSAGLDAGWVDYVRWVRAQNSSGAWNNTEFGDNRDIAIYHQQPTSYNDPAFSSGEYKGWCGVASSYIVLHSLDHDLPARLKTKYPNWVDPEFSRGLIEADPYIYHYGSTYAVESLMVNEGIGYDSGTAGYGYSDLTKIYTWLNSLNIGVKFEYKYVPLSEMKYYLQDGWMGVMNVQTGHYVAVVDYTYDNASDPTKEYFWILDPWPTSYIGPSSGTIWNPTTPDPDGDGKDEFNVNLTWTFRRLIWSRQPNGTTSYYQGIYVMTGEGVDKVFRDQNGNGTLIMLHATFYDSSDKYVLFKTPTSIPTDPTVQNDSVRLLKMVNGYLYSRVPGVLTEDNATMRVMNPENGTWSTITVPRGSVILKGVSPYYAYMAAKYTFGYASEIYEVDINNLSSTVHVLKMKAPRILLYTGTGTIYQKIYDSLIWMRFHVDAYSDPTTLDRLLDPSFRYSIIFMPGGSATDIANGIGETRLREIAQFVANGGGYIGVCAGSYLPIKGYNNATSWLEMVNASVNDTNPGEGEVTIKVVNANDPVLYGFNGQFTMMYYNGPPLIPGGLSTSTLNLPTPYPTTLATFVSGVSPVLAGRTAILHTTYGSGKIVLFSPHPEHDEVFPGRYLWRLFWNAIYTTSSENAVIGQVPVVPEFPDYEILVVLLPLLVVIVQRFRNSKDY
ncbi:MAG: hypothetical protein GXO25_05320 [Euryarchaeota archaeon]|nr:hypothetical protein [Euryarchaeota archaeon]